MRLVEFIRSPRPDKRFLAKFMEPERTVYFGTPKTSTYIDHGNKDIRDIHMMRHRMHLTKCNVINEDTMTMGVLWGPSQSVEGNLSRVLRLFNIQDDR
jgi:hypothetical protein